MSRTGESSGCVPVTLKVQIKTICKTKMGNATNLEKISSYQRKNLSCCFLWPFLKIIKKCRYNTSTWKALSWLLVVADVTLHDAEHTEWTFKKCCRKDHQTWKQCIIHKYMIQRRRRGRSEHQKRALKFSQSTVSSFFYRTKRIIQFPDWTVSSFLYHGYMAVNFCTSFKNLRSSLPE